MPDQISPTSLSPSAIRDHLANERTFLAWIRTGTALMGFGILIAKLRFLPTYEAENAPIPTGHAGDRTLFIGLLFALVGLSALLFAIGSYFHNSRAIDSATYHPHRKSLIGFVVILSCLGLASIVYLVALWR